MSTSTLTPAAERYVRAVADLLPELPDDEREELMSELAAHLAEVGDDDIETTLGTPADFVGEYRRSAGIEGGARRRRGRPFGRLRGTPAMRSVERSWGRFRPTWVVARGWVAISLLSLGWDRGFETFPIPRIGSTTGGAVAVAVATWVSLRFSRSTSARGRRLDGAFTASTAVLWLAVAAVSGLTLLTARGLPDPVVVAADPAGPPNVLLGVNGPIGNIFAYDEAGEPVRVLLYDEHGDPIRTLPDFAYDQYREVSGLGEPFVWEGYEVRLPTDSYGRVVPNLYPLERYPWTERGTLPTTEPPPIVGIPRMVTTTTAPEAPVAPTGGTATTPETTPPLSDEPEATAPTETFPAAG